MAITIAGLVPVTALPVFTTELVTNIAGCVRHAGAHLRRDAGPEHE
jgi:hypothetical protein